MSAPEIREAPEAGHRLVLSVIIPAHNEAKSLPGVLRSLHASLTEHAIPHELLVVDDHSLDGTSQVVEAVARQIPTARCVENRAAQGFGLAVRAGLDEYGGDAVAIVMADGSDFPEDVVRCYGLLQDGYDCAFGSRFLKESRVVDYPWFKLAVNRLANLFIRLLFRIPLNDTTNAFKCYRRETIDGIRPILSNHFNLTVEMPLKAMVRGFSYGIIPIGWRNRTEGVSKLKLKEMGSRYLFIVMYVWLERHLAKGDYRKAVGDLRETGRPGRQRP